MRTSWGRGRGGMDRSGVNRGGAGHRGRCLLSNRRSGACRRSPTNRPGPPGRDTTADATRWPPGLPEPDRITHRWSEPDRHRKTTTSSAMTTHGSATCTGSNRPPSRPSTAYTTRPGSFASGWGWHDRAGRRAPVSRIRHGWRCAPEPATSSRPSSRTCSATATSSSGAPSAGMTTCPSASALSTSRRDG
jgi:hypothetical protein